MTVMTTFVDTYPVAQKRHRCGLCLRCIEPGEPYWRQAGLDGGTAWTTKTCEHCERVVWAYGRSFDEYECDPECAPEWLEDEYPAVAASRDAGWRFPDGELLPVPFGSRCIKCGCRVEFRHLWCGPCNEKRIDTLNRQFSDIRAAFRARHMEGMPS